jgi:hypothetical protein
MSKKTDGENPLRLVGPNGTYQKGLDTAEVDFRDDRAQKGRNTPSMNDITREEFNAKLETIEARMDARVESVSSKIDAFLATQSAVQIERDKAQAERDKRLDGILAQIGKDQSDTKSSISSMKTTLIVTAVSTVLAIVLGVASFNTALTANMMSAFQLGKGDSTANASAQTAPKPASVPEKPATNGSEQK